MPELKMKELNVLQSFIESNHIKTIENFPLLNGITTIPMGNFGIKNNENVEERIFDLMSITETEMGLRIVPEHSDNIEIFSIVGKELTKKKETFNIKCDAIICRRQSHSGTKIALLSPTADCPIVIIASKSNDVGAIIHSGWKGTKKEIVPKTIEKFKKIGIRADDMQVGIFGGICGLCYKVGNEFKDFFPGYVSGNNQLNIQKIIWDQVQNAGVYKISTMPDCSAHKINGRDREFLFHSARREKEEMQKQNMVFVSL